MMELGKHEACKYEVRFVQTKYIFRYYKFVLQTPIMLGVEK